MIGKYKVYKCTKCGYIFIQYRSDVVAPVICPKCGGIAKEILYPISTKDIINFLKNLFKEKKWKSFI